MNVSVAITIALLCIKFHRKNSHQLDLLMYAIINQFFTAQVTVEFLFAALHMCTTILHWKGVQ